MFTVTAEITESQYRRLEDAATVSGCALSWLLDAIMQSATNHIYTEQEGTTTFYRMPTLELARVDRPEETDR
jgi:hypothetical protein